MARFVATELPCPAITIAQQLPYMVLKVLCNEYFGELRHFLCLVLYVVFTTVEMPILLLDLGCFESRSRRMLFLHDFENTLGTTFCYLLQSSSVF